MTGVHAGFARISVLLLVLPAFGCRHGSGEEAREQERAIMKLEVEVESLRMENRRLVQRVEALEREEAGEGAALLARPSSLTATGAATGAAIPARCTPAGADTGFTLSRTAFDAALTDSGSMASEARIVPNFQDGRATGFKLYAIRPDSLFASCGVKNGDVLQRVNGMEINSPDMALEAYSKLKNAGRIELALTRAGKPETVLITLAAP